MKFIYLTIIILALFSGVLELFNLHLSSQLASDSVEVRQMQMDLQKYREKNEILTSQILDFSSFDKLASKAAALGFKESQSYISLNPPVEASAIR